MRSDMYRVVIERPRFGHRRLSRKWGKRVDESYEGPAFVSPPGARREISLKKQLNRKELRTLRMTVDLE